MSWIDPQAPGAGSGSGAAPQVVKTDEPLATVAEWTTRRGTAPPNTEQADALLAGVSAIIRDLAQGQIISRVKDDAIVMDGRGRARLLLPQVPVVSVSEVVVDDSCFSVVPGGGSVENTLTEGVGYTVTPEGVLTRIGYGFFLGTSAGPRWPWGDQNVRVTYTHGIDPVPLSVKEVVFALAERTLASPSGRTVMSEQLGRWVTQYGPVAAAGMTELELAVIRRYTPR